MNDEAKKTQYLVCQPAGFTCGQERGFVFMLIDADTGRANTKVIAARAVLGDDFIKFLNGCWGFDGNESMLPAPYFLQIVPLDISSLYAMQIVIEYHKRGINLIAGFPVDHPGIVAHCWKRIVVPVDTILRSRGEGFAYFNEVEGLLKRETERHNEEAENMMGGNS